MNVARSQPNGFPEAQTSKNTVEISYREVQRERVEIPISRVRNPPTTAGYRTQLGNQSMI